MKNLLICFLVLYSLGHYLPVTAQCSSAQETLDVNEVNAGLLSGGDMFWDLDNARYEVPKGSGVNAIFAGALWFGAVDDQGGLKVAAQTYRQMGTDFQPGPIGSGAASQEEICALYDRFWSVTAVDIASFRSNFNAGNVSSLDDIPQSILDWPGRNSSYTDFPVGDVQAAPFVDSNQDGNYDPLLGDYPDVRGDQAIWWIYNDQKSHEETEGDPLNIQVGVTAYAFNQEPLQYTTFYKYDLLNAGPTDLDGLYIGQWLDVDLGCFANDYVGCLPEEDLAFAYNGNLESSTCDSGYDDILPILGFKLIEGIPDAFGNESGMNSFMSYNNDFEENGNPEEAIHYYNYLRGYWKDGTAITTGGNGYGGTEATSFMYSGNPTNWADEGVWSECSTENEPGDRRFLAGMGPSDLDSGESKSFTVAIIWDDANTATCPDISDFKESTNDIKQLHKQLTNETNAGISEVHNSMVDFKYQPNPMESRIEFRWHPESPVPELIDILGVNGELLLREKVTTENQFILERNNLSSGMYFFQFLNADGKLASGKFLVN